MNITYQGQRKQTALITGASGGIGYELAKLFAQDGYNLVLVARSGQKLTQIADDFKQKYGIAAKVIAKDLSIPTSPEEIFTELQQESIKIDVLVNNAGFASYGLFHEIDMNSELQMMQVNVVCLTHLTKLFLKDMVKQGSGKILNLASTAAFQPGPLMAVYYATKAYVLSCCAFNLYIERGQDARTTIILRFPLVQSSCASAYHFQKRSPMNWKVQVLP